MLPALAIILFFALGLAFFVLSSSNDFGIDKLKNNNNSNEIDRSNKDSNEEKQSENSNKEGFINEVIGESNEEKEAEESNEEWGVD